MHGLGDAHMYGDNQLLVMSKVLKIGTVKKPEKELISSFLVKLGFNRWSNR